MTRQEAALTTRRNSLVVLSPIDEIGLVDEFCGTVIRGADHEATFDDQTVYLAGDLAEAHAILEPLSRAARVLVIRDLALGNTPLDVWATVRLGQVPLTHHGLGVLYREFFEPAGDYFAAIETGHAFQSLTESNKPGVAHRTGLYLTQVDQVEDDLHFRLLRCSTNLSGPTENFNATDHAIVDALNEEAGFLFEGASELNHVLAQIYPNLAATGTQRERKAKIGTHADKTKDMPDDGIMAFCTFYDDVDGLDRIGGGFDLGIGGTSAMTRLEFRLKTRVTKAERRSFPDRFSVVLYPNSVFLMPLSTNRLYTHAIRASALDAADLPTRLGYVVRCSNAEAVHRDGATYLKRADEIRPLLPATETGVGDLRALYADENRSSKFIDYADRFDFSMNSGDYETPRI